MYENFYFAFSRFLYRIYMCVEKKNGVNNNKARKTKRVKK